MRKGNTTKNIEDIARAKVRTIADDMGAEYRFDYKKARPNRFAKQSSSRHEMNWRERIVIDPAIHHGDPCIKGTRVPVSIIVSSIADGDTAEQLYRAYPQLTADDIRAALKFAAEAVSNADFIPLH